MRLKNICQNFGWGLCFNLQRIHKLSITKQVTLNNTLSWCVEPWLNVLLNCGSNFISSSLQNSLGLDRCQPVLIYCVIIPSSLLKGWCLVTHSLILGRQTWKFGSFVSTRFCWFKNRCDKTKSCFLSSDKKLVCDSARQNTQFAPVEQWALQRCKRINIWVSPVRQF